MKRQGRGEALKRRFFEVEGQLEGQSGGTKINNWRDKSQFLGGAYKVGNIPFFLVRTRKTGDRG